MARAQKQIIMTEEQRKKIEIQAKVADNQYARERAIMAFRYACSCGRNAGNDYPCPDYLDCIRFRMFANCYDGIKNTCGSCRYFGYEDIAGLGECNNIEMTVHCEDAGCSKFKPKDDEKGAVG